MQRSLLLAMTLMLACGCTHIKLQRNTVHQGSTLSELQYQQVLENLAMFSCDPNVLAWHLKVTGGLVQVADQGGAALVPSNVSNPLLAPNIAASRNLLGQWNVDAVVESDGLELLQLAYQKAVRPGDEQRELKQEAFEKICELSAEYHIVLTPEVSDEAIATYRIGASPERLQRLDRVQKRLHSLYAQLEEFPPASDTPEPSITEKVTDPHFASNQVAIKREILALTSSLCKQPFIAGHSVDKAPRGAATVDQAEDKIQALVELFSDQGEEFNPFSTPWLGQGCKRDVPPCACYVAHFHGCQGDCSVWVLPEHAKTLRAFVLIILSLVPPDAPEFSMPRSGGVGAAFSPNS